jgi:single-stranded-DNA-specific exonuclease
VGDRAVGEQDDLLWLAALGLIGDRATPFPELETAEARWGKTALKDATSLVNAPRRTAAADPASALRLLMDPRSSPGASCSRRR